MKRLFCVAFHSWEMSLTHRTGQMHMVRKKIADTTGEIAAMIIEDPAGAWPEMLPFLFQSGRSANAPLRESAMLIIARLTFAASEVILHPPLRGQQMPSPRP
jgi:hypothetical protein